MLWVLALPSAAPRVTFDMVAVRLALTRQLHLLFQLQLLDALNQMAPAIRCQFACLNRIYACVILGPTQSFWGQYEGFALHPESAGSKSAVSRCRRRSIRCLRDTGGGDAGSTGGLPPRI